MIGKFERKEIAKAKQGKGDLKREQSNKNVVVVVVV